jgi:hypothetical protein
VHCWARASFNPSRHIITGTGRNSAKLSNINIHNRIGFLHAVNFGQAGKQKANAAIKHLFL